MEVQDCSPLRFDLRGKISQLVSAHPRFPFPDALVDSASRTTEVLNCVARLLAFPALTDEVSSHFRPILMDLCCRWLDLDDIDPHRIFESFAALARPHKEIFPIMTEYFSRANRMHGPFAFILSSVVIELPARPLQRLLVAYHRLLCVDESFPSRNGWPLTPLARLVHTPHPDPGVRVLAILCYSIQAGHPETMLEKAYWEYLGEPGGIDAPVEVGEALVGDAVVPVDADGWVIRFIEEKRRCEKRAALANAQDYYISENSQAQITHADLSLHVLDICGTLMFKADRSPPASTPMVITPSVTNALRTLALMISDRLPALLTSPPGAGKSLLIQHLAAQLYPSSASQVVSLHLSDTSIDPKSLLGSYMPSPTISGSFDWVEGPLCAAMRTGKWLVLEDIDKASQEVLGTILPLVESLGACKGPGDPATISIPGKQVSVRAHPGFALFATRSIHSSFTQAPSRLVFLGSHHWFELHIPKLTADEQEAILHSLFPHLSILAVRELVRIFEAVRATAGTGSSKANLGVGKARDLGLRDLIKWTRRVEQYFPVGRSGTTNIMDVDGDDSGKLIAGVFSNPELKDRIFLEARDIFFGSTSSIPFASGSGPGSVTAEQLQLSVEQAEWVLGARTPELHIERSPSDGHVMMIRIGRTSLSGRPLRTSHPVPNTTVNSFALHRPSLMLLEQLATAVRFSEPLLLVGETGTGKTTAIQYLASLLSHPLTVFNLSNQTEVSDLIGGFKPIDARIPASNLFLKFISLFCATFNARRNIEFDQAIRKAIQGAKWKRAVAMWRDAISKAISRIREVNQEQLDPETPRKRRRMDVQADAPSPSATEEGWRDFESGVDTFEAQHIHGKAKLAFAFVEGPLVRAIRDGHWVLLDEINLASPETLEAITPLLQSPDSSLTLTEKGSLEPVPRHPAFRLFASMNPATDVGKRDLPPVMRSSFTELWVPAPDADREALLAIIGQRISHIALADGRSVIADVADFYESMRKLSGTRQISDGSNQRPHFSMRTLTRALTFATDVHASFGLRRAIWEGCLMAFTMTLDARSAELVRPIAERHLLSGVKNKTAFISQPPSHAGHPDEHVTVGPFQIRRGPRPPDPMDSYILTPSVQSKLVDLARIICTRRFPVLIEGPTSAGKTSSIEYLARRTGHQFVRINNHEHTDIQEYIGSYVSDSNTGKLVFRDGVLVRALRQGHWLVLDELNLAPTDVLEALNRLLDDNRELLIPETQELIAPHPDFMLFATQNPSGLYAGRKVLSRAFRNRFIEIHFADVPQAELETIIHQRCKIAPSYAHRIVAVFRELQSRRQMGRVFESKHGFATLRDLFRWAWRGANGYQQLAEDGYMLLAERARRPEDRTSVREAIEGVMKVKINTNTLYNLDSGEGSPAARLGLKFERSSRHVWTSAFQRLLILVATSLQHHEPVLLVGETGAGKTSVCQYFADVLGRELHTLNCHQNTETADLIGGQRPVRNRTALKVDACRQALACLEQCGVSFSHLPTNDVGGCILAIEQTLQEKGRTFSDIEKLRQSRRALRHAESLFEWCDGPLVTAMAQGDIFLMDEISLADDSVLERLNSVLEPERSLILAEKGGWSGDNTQVSAAPGFKLVATMNPGGDYGKKELSPALRNRFTEIWVPQITLREDRKQILDSMWESNSGLYSMSDPILDFADKLAEEVGDPNVLGLRDIQAWANFTNVVFSKYRGTLSEAAIFHHAARLAVLDGLATFPQVSSLSTDAVRRSQKRMEDYLHELVPATEFDPWNQRIFVSHDSQFFNLGLFKLPLGPNPPTSTSFTLKAPTAFDNAMRVIRACQLDKPILLEGSPGVGKTSLVTALASSVGHRLCRINFSDQSDIMDLFGADLPVEGGLPGEFQWRDASFLRALQVGDWVLLDEMNLASQAVLEGLNAILDHRGTVFIPELGQTFTRHPNFRIFAAQNPLGQGGGRKGLPKSFLNRFTKVHIQELGAEDLLFVCQQDSPDVPVDTLRAMIGVNKQVQDAITIKRTIGSDGAPWEFNLRDVLRWIRLTKHGSHSSGSFNPAKYFRALYLQRFRNSRDRAIVEAIFQQAFPDFPLSLENPRPSASPSRFRVGHSSFAPESRRALFSKSLVLQQQLPTLEALRACLDQGWLVILVGPNGSGKTSLAQLVAERSGQQLRIITMSASIDTSDLLGGFDQVDLSQQLHDLVEATIDLSEKAPYNAIASMPPDVTHSIRILRRWLNSPHPATPRPDLLAAVRQIVDYHKSTKLEELLSMLENQAEFAAKGRFDWVDGPLVRAVKSGTWLLLDNTNLCSPAVLDRLNSLTETHGTLTLSERGLVNGEVQVLQPHPNFRLLMAIDPSRGELSRAMRNRGVELYIEPIHNAEDGLRVASSNDIASPQRNAQEILSFQRIRRGNPCSGIALPTRLFLGDISRTDTVTNSLQLLADVVSQSPTTQSLVAFAAMVISPLEWNRAMRAVATLSNQSPKYEQLLRGLRSIRNSALYGPHIPTGEKYLASDDYEGSNLDAQLNPHYTSCKGGLLALPLNAFMLAAQMQERTTLPAPPPHSPLHASELLEAGKMPLQEIHDAVRWLAPVMTLSRKAAHEVLQGVGIARLPDSIPEIATASMVESLSSFLRDVSTGSSFNLTATRAVSNWLSSALAETSSTFDELRTAAQSLGLATSLRRGHYISALWRSFLSDEGDDELKALQRDLLKNLSGNRLVRMGIVELLAAVTLKPHQHPAERRETIGLGNELLRKNAETKSVTSIDTAEHFEASLMLAELETLARSAPDKSKIHLANVVIEKAVEADVDPSNFVPFRAIIWVWERCAGWSSDDLAIRLRVQRQWLDRIWHWGNNRQVEKGPSNLCRAILTEEAMFAWEHMSTKLISLDNEEIYLHRQQTLALAMTNGEPRPRTSILTGLLLENIQLLVQALDTAYSEQMLRRISAHVEDYHVAKARSLRDLASCLTSSTNSTISAAFARYICPVLGECPEHHTSPTEHGFWTWLGQAWTAFARLIFELYVPDAVLDPLVVQDCEDSMRSIRAASLSDMIAVLSSHESILTGNPSNPLVETLSRERDTCNNASRHAVPRRPDIPRLNALYSEILRFMEQLLPRLPGDSSVRTGSQPLRDVVLQSSLGSFMQRLESSYADFGDLTQTLLWGVGCLRLGVSLSFAGDSSNASSEASTMAYSLVRFPSISSAENWNSIPTSDADVDHILHHIASIAYQAEIDGCISDRSNDLHHWFSRVVTLWLRDNAREQREREEASSIYKSSKLDHSAPDGSQTEDEEIQHLFPRYMGDAGDVSTAPATVAHPATRTRAVSQDHMKDVIRFHFQLFHPEGYGKQERSWYTDRRRNVLTHFLATTTLGPSSASLDATSHSWRVSLYRDLLTRFQTQNANSSRLNFYHDPNPGEIRRAIPVLRGLQLRIESILREWPDQMVLQHLIDHCQNILDYPLRSPVARVLAALERLLVRTDDWEGYASRDNSLKLQQNELIALIIEWRRLELRGWSQLLDSEAAAFNDGASEWWFRLYEMLVIGTLSSAATDETNGSGAAEEHTARCVPLIDDYMIASPLGQFQARLDLLRSFSIFLDLLASQDTSLTSAALKHASRLAHSQADHYGYLLPDVQAELSRGKEPIQKEILDYIKLASWKDVNVYALKQSAEKTHRHLHRCIRKYRESLRRPVTVIGVSPFQPLREPPPIPNKDPTLPIWKSTPSSVGCLHDLSDSPHHLKNLAHTHSRFQRLLQEQLKLYNPDVYASTVEGLSSHIVETIQALSSTTIPAGSREQRQKSINSMVSQKRRAIVDLMKELRRLGLPQNPRPDILARQHSREKLFEFAIQHSCSDSTLLSSTRRSSRYYHSLIDGLQAVRDTVGSHHPDFTTRDIQRLLSLTESSFSFGLAAQEKFTSAVTLYDQLIRICQRLQVIADDPHNHITKAGNALARDAHLLARRLGHVVDAATELINHCNALSTSESTDSSRESIQELQEHVERSRSLLLSMKRLTASLCEGWTFFTATEDQLLQSVRIHINGLQDVLMRSARRTVIFAPACQATAEWVRELIMSASSPSDLPPRSARPGAVIDSMLLAAQNLRGWSQERPHLNDGKDLFVIRSFDIGNVLQSLRFKDVLSHIESYLKDVFQLDAECNDFGEQEHEVVQIRVFLEEFLLFSHHTLLGIADWIKSVLKLAWIVCGLVNRLAREGLCKPSDTPESSNDVAGEPLEGAGMGSGLGDKDISNEVEDASQVEGLQGEEQPPSQHNTGDAKEEDNALEMEEDFEGDLMDPDDTGADDDSPESDGDSRPDLDEKIQDIGEDDADAIDEKLWGGEKGPDDPASSTDQTHDTSTNKHKDDSDIVAKADRETDPRQDPEPNQGPEENQHQMSEGEPPDGTDGAEDLPEDSDQPDERGRKLDDTLQEANTLNLPEDMDLDLDADGSSDGGVSLEDEAMDDASEGLPDNADHDAETGQAETGDRAIPQDDECESVEPDAVQGEGSTLDSAADAGAFNDAQAQDAQDGQKGGPADSVSGHVGASTQEPKESPSEENEQSGNGKETLEDAQPMPQAEDSKNHSSAGDGGAGAGPSGSQGDTSSTPPPQTTSNPLRSLGDTLRSIRRRFEEISERVGSDDDRKQATEADSREDERMEYAAPDDPDHDKQALGPSLGHEQISKLSDLRIDDSETVEQVSMAEEPIPEAQISEGQPQPLGTFDPFDLSTPAPEGGSPDALPRAATDTSLEDTKDCAVRDLAFEGIADPELQRMADESVETELRRWQDAGQPDDGARELWARYSSVTHNLAYDLCEQLRLILEPTLASRLKGDYRTGKRLNMKKVIPYIASEFTKDKIWLRRSRPSKREYQILLALDDSKSMREGRSAHLAFETLALVTKALDRLEAGDTAIVRFGETVDVLHDFSNRGGTGSGFRDADGAKVLQNFHFDQRATNVLSLLEHTLEVLADARVRNASGSSADLWQLEIIISDGRCQDHEKLRSILRRASEERVMVVFVVVDALRAQGQGKGSSSTNSSSILSMNQATYSMVNGKMELQLQRYLDSFPFEYYVVLRDVESLPDVLAGTLKQFFERMSEE